MQSYVYARLVGFQFEKLIGDVEIMVLMFNQQVTSPMRCSHYHDNFTSSQHHFTVAIFCSIENCQERENSSLKHKKLSFN